MGLPQKILYFIGLGVIGTFFSQAVDRFALQCMERFGIASGDSLWMHGITDDHPRMTYFLTSMVHSFQNRGISIFSRDSASSGYPRLWITLLGAGIR